MSLRVGRAVLGSGPYQIRADGDLLAFMVDIAGVSVDEAKARRQQLLGLEPGRVVPVVWSDDPDWDGFYRVVQSPSVSPVETYLVSGFMSVSLVLERIGRGFATAWIEVLQNVTKRAVGGSSDALSAVPAGALWSEIDMGAVASVDELAVESDGVLDAVTIVKSVGAADRRFVLDPDRFFVGAATVEQLRDGVWWPVVGRQMSPSPLRSEIRISNGAVRVVFQSSRFRLERYRPGVGWRAGAWIFIFSEDAGGGGTENLESASFSVVHESVERVTVRMLVTFESSPGDVWTFTLRRGDRFLDVSVRPAAGRASKASFQSSSADFSFGPVDVLLPDADSAEGVRSFFAALAWDSSTAEVAAGAVRFDGPADFGVFARLAADDALFDDYGVQAELWNNARSEFQVVSV